MTCFTIAQDNVKYFQNKITVEKAKKIITYSTPDCAYCYTLKSYLKEKGFGYEEIDIQEKPEEREKMEKISGQKNVPVTVIDGEIVIGWNKKKIKQLLNI